MADLSLIVSWTILGGGSSRILLQLLVLTACKVIETLRKIVKLRNSARHVRAGTRHSSQELIQSFHLEFPPAIQVPVTDEL